MSYSPLIPLIFTLRWLMENYPTLYPLVVMYRSSFVQIFLLNLTQCFVTTWLIHEYYVPCLIRSSHFHELRFSYKCNLAGKLLFECNQFECNLFECNIFECVPNDKT